MYLAQKRIKGKYQFFIRESYRDGNVLRSRELFSLGPDPSRYIVYPGGHAFYIDETVTDALERHDVEVITEELDHIFWPFLKPEIRHILEPYHHRSGSRTQKRGLNKDTLPRSVHPFDKHRLCYLRFGRINKRIMGRLPERQIEGLYEKSRDEMEQYFIKKERCLQTREYRQYTCAIFDLQKFFPESFSSKKPEWLNQQKTEEYFLQEICRLHEDRSFWAGEYGAPGQSLHHYMRRYVIMFFDHEYQPRDPLFDYVRDFMNRHRFRHPPQETASISLEKASIVFGVEKETLRTMTKRGLTRYYRHLAKKYHPDKGGSQEKFVTLTNTYHALLKKRGWA